MNKPLLHKRLIFALALLLALQGLGAGRAIAQPALPSSFYGTVTYENAPILAGIPVTAWIDGVPYTTTYTLLDASSSVYRINIQADNPFTAPIETGEEMEGKAIEFRVNNNVIDDINPTWHTGTNVLLDLAYYDNRVPVAKDKILIVAPPDSLTFTLEASDEDGDPLTFERTSDPQYGTFLLDLPPALIYLPSTDFPGRDSFNFIANDGKDNSIEATVILRTNAAPSIKADEDLKEESPEDTPLPIDLNKYFEDLDGDELTFEILDSPVNGSLSGVAPNITYTPNPNFPGMYDTGLDSFSFEACDPYGACGEATINLTITQVNDPPNANPITFTAFINTIDNELNLFYFEYSCPTPENPSQTCRSYHISDYEGDSVKWEIVDQPEHGEELGETSYPFFMWLYTPNTDFSGIDNFTYRIKEDKTTEEYYSNTATVTINVIERPEADYSIFLPLILK